MIHYTGWPEHLVDELQMHYFRRKYFDTKLEKIMDNKIVLKIFVEWQDITIIERVLRRKKWKWILQKKQFL